MILRFYLKVIQKIIFVFFKNIKSVKERKTHVGTSPELHKNRMKRCFRDHYETVLGLLIGVPKCVSSGLFKNLFPSVWRLFNESVIV